MKKRLKNMCRTAAGIFPASVLLLAMAVSCQGRQGKLRSENSRISANSDSSLLFDGRTLDGWEITNFGPQGSVYVSEGKIILEMGDGCTGITWKKEFPPTNYEVTLEAMRIEGNDFFCGMTFPAGKDPCTLIIGGWGGTVVGLSSIDGMDASENETTKLRKFERDQWYRIRLKVSEKAILAWIDDEIVVDFTIDDKSLSIRPEVELSKPFGIASWRTTAALRNIRLSRK
jgi:hypothetical protein